MKYLIVDIETTGLSCSNHVITAIGTIAYNTESPHIHVERCFNVAKARKCGSVHDMDAMQMEVMHLFDHCDKIVAFNGINFDFPFIVKWLGEHYDNDRPNTSTLTAAGEKIAVSENLQVAGSNVCVRPTRGEHTEELTNREVLTEEHTDREVLTEEHTDKEVLTEEHTDRKVFTEEHTDREVLRGIEHGNQSRKDFVNTMQTIHELDSNGKSRVAGINNTSRRTLWPSKYVDFCLKSLEYTNKYISLKNLCSMNCVKAVKSGTGVDAIGFAKKEQWAELEHYCQQDVRVLLELTQRALSHGLKYPCQGYTSCADLVHVMFDVVMTSSVRPADLPAGQEMSIFQAIPKEYQQANPKRPRMP